MIFKDVLAPALKEADSQLSTSLNMEHIQSTIDEIYQHKPQGDIDDILSNLRPQAEEISCFNWLLREAKLCDVSAEAIKSKSDDLRKRVDALKASNDKFEDSVREMMDKRSLKTNYISSRPELNASVNMKLAEELEDMLHDTQRNIQLINRLTYCQVKSLSSTCINVEAIFTASFRVSIIFDVSESSRLIENVAVDISNSNLMSQEDLLASSYFADILADETLCGPLSSKYLLQFEKVSQIRTFITKVRKLPDVKKIDSFK